MSNVYKRPDGRWFFRKCVRLPNGKQARVFGTPREFGLPNTKVATQEAMARKVAAVLSGQAIKVEAPKPVKKGPTLSEFVPVALEASESRNKHSSVDSKRQIFRDHIEPKLGAFPLRDVTYAAIEDFKHGLLRPRGSLGAKTVNNVLTVLRRMLVVAKKRGLIDSVPEIEWLRTEPSGFSFLSFDEATALIGACDEEWTAMVTLALRTGMRQGELLGLRWDDVDLAAGRVHVQQTIVRGRLTTPKNHKAREIPLSGDAAAALKAHRHLRGAYVFCDLDGKPMTKGACKHPLWRACRGAKLKRIGWHVLRHTFASHLAMRGVPLKTIMDLMGHSEIRMTLRYAHLSPEVTRDAVMLLDAGVTPVTNGGTTSRTTADGNGR